MSTPPESDAGVRARTARLKTVADWTEHDRKRALILLAGRWPGVFDAIRDQVESGEENEPQGLAD